jgi:polyisoprenoid-binding protein YceI
LKSEIKKIKNFIAMKKLFALLLFIFLTTKITAETDEQIIVFTQSSDKVFIEKTYPQLRAYCLERGITILERTITEGLPTEITTTPAVIFQNPKGRSIYSARYTSFSTVVNFIRNCRFFPAETSVNDCKSNVLFLKNGRSTIIAPIKITELTSTNLPKNFDQNTFKEAATAAILRGGKNALNDGKKFQMATSDLCKSKTDRAFYMDFHPYRNADSMYFLTVELYSQYSCIDPIFTNKGEAFTGKDIMPLFEKAAKTLELEIMNAVNNSQIGDAVSFVSDKIAVKSWEELSLTLPKEIKKATAINSNIDIPKNWQYAGALDKETPVLQFRFQPPLNRYVGEVKTMKGSLKMSDAKTIKEAYFEATMNSLTMGDEDFDHKVLEKYIKVQRYPDAKFSFKNVVLPKNLKVGEVVELPIKGNFIFMKKEKELTVNAKFTPVLDDNGKPQMEISVQFSLNITDGYGIQGPDGPEEARKNMAFFMNFKLTNT